MKNIYVLPTTESEYKNKFLKIIGLKYDMKPNIITYYECDYEGEKVYFNMNDVSIPAQGKTGSFEIVLQDTIELLDRMNKFETGNIVN